jgi:hypothetical protein
MAECYYPVFSGCCKQKFCKLALDKYQHKELNNERMKCPLCREVMNFHTIDFDATNVVQKYKIEVGKKPIDINSFLTCYSFLKKWWHTCKITNIAVSDDNDEWINGIYQGRNESDSSDDDSDDSYETYSSDGSDSNNSDESEQEYIIRYPTPIQMVGSHDPFELFLSVNRDPYTRAHPEISRTSIRESLVNIWHNMSPSNRRRFIRSGQRTTSRDSDSD